jgi:hypothetical protein
MKFMYEYCTTFFDTRHLVIAVNPRHIEMYESLLFFKRLTANVVENYDFVNGAPAVGAALDLKHAPEVMRKAYASKPPNRNLHRYFCETKLPNIQIPHRRFFTTNDPVMTPDLIDYFFNQRTTVFADLSDRKKALLHLIYDLPEYKKVLRPRPATASRGRYASTAAFRSNARPAWPTATAGERSDPGRGQRGFTLRFPRPRRPADTGRRVAQCHRPTGPQRSVPAHRAGGPGNRHERPSLLRLPHRRARSGMAKIRHGAL